MILKTIDKKKLGKKSRAMGASFENKVREDLESKGFICDKWTNNVDLEYHSGGHYVQGEFISKGKLIIAKPKYLFINGSMRMVGNKSGFPDFICFRTRILSNYEGELPKNLYEVIGVESKMSGELDHEEKQKCKWLLDNKIFSNILIAEKTKVKNKVVIVYHDFKEKYWRFYGSKD